MYTAQETRLIQCHVALLKALSHVLAQFAHLNIVSRLDRALEPDTEDFPVCFPALDSRLSTTSRDQDVSP